MQVNRTKIKLAFPFLSILVLSGVLMTGCTQNHRTTQKQAIVTASSNLNEQQQTEIVSVIRYGRYRLVEIEATSEQRALLSQIVDLNIPLSANNKTTVTQGLNYLLLNSGYRLCSKNAIGPLSRLELPLAHYHLGPIRLHDALEVLVGNAWRIEVDDRERTVCFSPINTSSDIQSKQEVNHETL